MQRVAQQGAAHGSTRQRARTRRTGRDHERGRFAQRQQPTLDTTQRYTARDWQHAAGVRQHEAYDSRDHAYEAWQRTGSQHRHAVTAQVSGQPSTVAAHSTQVTSRAVRRQQVTACGSAHGSRRQTHGAAWQEQALGTHDTHHVTITLRSRTAQHVAYSSSTWHAADTHRSNARHAAAQKADPRTIRTGKRQNVSGKDEKGLGAPRF